MQQLTNAEEQLMEHFGNWRKPYERFTEAFPEPKPKTTTVHFTEKDD
jgi:hypothetical protein